MSSLKTLSLVLVLLSHAPAAQATGLVPPPDAPIGADDPLVVLFATCAGRYSALMEFQWLTDGPASEETARRRAAMLDLAGAVTPAAASRRALHLRIEAKAAQSALLHAAHFRADPRATRRAETLLAGCRALHPG
ncbi:hypothetical protein [Szabonella alba]|uniref:Uncharacterized protein n=1 Tax=Szabonella alba TaxID=2804194 RepID=A0A8K0V870_9RHOB|nr:hypothetical protein [Szabonella alba]MBL4917272.1 hypothetical protein [Szabonella alba]